MKNVKKLQELAKSSSVLYVEDNESLRLKTTQLLKKFFENIYVAKNGLEGLETYKMHHQDIVITDLRMPELDGFSMCEKILKINPNVKIIVTTAHDEKDYLMQAIKYGVFQYLKKPLDVEGLIDTLCECLTKSSTSYAISSFESEISKIFNYQNNLLVLMKKDTPIFANPKFYDFFGVENIEDFVEKVPDLGTIFLEQRGFLYTQLNITWYDQIVNSKSDLFHAKLKDLSKKEKHFILKIHKITDSDDEYILSFDDISELGLMNLFVEKKDGISEKPVLSNHLETLLQIINNNNAKLGLLNFYKGLTIANDAQVVSFKKGVMKVKSTYYQLKIINMDKHTTIRSRFFPNDIEVKCDSIDYESQTATFSDLNFVTKSSSNRKYVRVEPRTSNVALLHQNVRYDGEVKDISMKSVKVVLPVLPPSSKKDVMDGLCIEIANKDETLVFTCKAQVYRVDEFERHYEVIYIIFLQKKDEKRLLDYISHRQIELIREFKSIQR